MTGLRKIRENIPRKVTVAEVFKERREFVSLPSSSTISLGYTEDIL